MYIECEGQKYNFEIFRIDNAILPNMASFEGFIMDTDFYGKTVKLVLSDFEDEIEYNASIGFLFDNLSGVWDTMTPLNLDDFIDIGTYITYADGSKLRMYTLPVGTQNVKFSEKYLNAYIDNFGFNIEGESKTKGLYISIVPGSKENAEALKNLAFKNIITGDIIPSMYPSQGENVDFSLNDKRIILLLSQWTDKYYNGEIRDLTASDLSNYIIVENPSSEIITREQGTWSFDFNVDTKAEAKVYNVNQNVQINGDTITIDSITISPLKLYIKGTSTSSLTSKPKMTDAYFVMSDGSKQVISHKGSGGEFDTTIDLQFILDKPVNVEDIQSLNIWDAVVPLK